MIKFYIKNGINVGFFNRYKSNLPQPSPSELEVLLRLGQRLQPGLLKG